MEAATPHHAHHAHFDAPTAYSRAAAARVKSMSLANADCSPDLRSIQILTRITDSTGPKISSRAIVTG